MRVSLDLRVMAHPSRLSQASRLAARLGATLVVDPDPDGPPSALRTSLEAWTRNTGRKTSHRLVAQDDAVVCTGFVKAATRMLKWYPDAMVAFYIGGAHPGQWYYQSAARRCEVVCELPLHHFVPTVCLAMPSVMAERWAAWTREHVDPAYAYDDEALRMYRESQVTVPAVATIPCLAQHSNTGPSIIGHQHHGQRQAACFIGAYDAEQLWR